ncbi:MAG: DUF433 domain-containing protein [Thermoguttaceae bacterium]
MTLDSLYLEMHSEDDVRVKGTRVGIEHLLSAYLAGSLPEEMAIEFPTLTLEQVHGIIAWYLRNREDADAYLHRRQRRARRARAQQREHGGPEIVQRLRRLAEQRVAG